MKILQHFNEVHSKQAQGRLLRYIGLLALMLFVINASIAMSDEKHAFWSEQGKGHEELIRRRDNPLWDVFKKEFAEK